MAQITFLLERRHVADGRSPNSDPLEKEWRPVGKFKAESKGDAETKAQDAYPGRGDIQLRVTGIEFTIPIDEVSPK